MGGGCASHRTARENSIVVCCGKTSTAETCTEQLTMLMTLLGFLWALLLLAGIILWSDPTGYARMFRLVRRPILVPVHRPAPRFLSSALPWWFYSIIAPPGQAAPTPLSPVTSVSAFLMHDFKIANCKRWIAN